MKANYFKLLFFRQFFMSPPVDGSFEDSSCIEALKWENQMIMTINLPVGPSFRLFLKYNFKKYYLVSEGLNV